MFNIDCIPLHIVYSVAGSDGRGVEGYATRADSRSTQICHACVF